MNITKISRKKVLAYFVAIFIPVALFTGLFIYVIYSMEVKNEQKIVEQREINSLSLERDLIKNNIFSIISDLKILSKTTEEYASSSGLMDIDELANYYYFLSSEKKIYDQIRFLDKDGNEIIRTDYNYGEPINRQKEELQNKGNRYYFTDTFKLGKGEIFVSPLDLNIENGVIERPSPDLDIPEYIFKQIWKEGVDDTYAKPMIRFGMPVFNEWDEKIGIVVMNYFGASLINYIDDMLSAQSHTLLANPEGYWIKGMSAENEWGFMREHECAIESNVKNDFPELWDKINQSQSGQFLSEKGLFTFSRIYPLEGEEIKSSVLSELNQNIEEKDISHDEYNWTAISYIPLETYNRHAKALFDRLFVLYLILLFLILLASVFISYLVEKNKERERERDMFQRQYNFVSTMSHQLRTPISSILLSLETVLDSSKNKQLKEIYNRMRSLSELVNKILITNEISEKYEVKNKSYFSILEVVELILNELKDRIEEKNISVKVNIPSSEDPVFAEKDKIKQALHSIISNSIEYNKRDGEVIIDYNGEDDEIEVSVSDTGIGIPKKEKSKVFDKFFRCSNASLGKNEGSGASLYLAKLFVEAHGGELSLDSKKTGSTFIVKLPLK